MHTSHKPTLAPDHSRYIAVETAINTAVSIGLSILSAWLFFHGQPTVDMGSEAVLWDVLPQSFAVAWMVVMVPTLQARHRLRAGTLRALPGRHRLPANVFLRSALAGSATAAFCTLAYAVFKPAPGLVIQPLGYFVALKAVFGAVLATTLTPIALFAALRDPN